MSKGRFRHLLRLSVRDHKRFALTSLCAAPGNATAGHKDGTTALRYVSFSLPESGPGWRRL